MGGEAAVVEPEVALQSAKLTEKDMETRVEKARDAVLDLCLPDAMTQEEARDFLEIVMSNLQGFLDALKDEIEAAQEA